MAGSHKKPIFILGAPRTGTTLLRLILNAHSNIVIPEELHFFRSTMFGHPIEDWDKPILASAGTSQELRTMIDFMAQDTEMPFLIELTEEVLKQDEYTLRDLYVSLMSKCADKADKPRWGEKTPENILYADILYQMFPDACFIVVYRDPRAVIASMNAVPFYTSCTYNNLLNYQFYLRYGYERAEIVIPASNRLSCTYEELAKNPVGSLQRICGFIGEGFEHEMLSFHETASASMSGSARDTYNKKALSAIDPKNIDAWKTKLKPEETAVINSVLDISDTTIDLPQSVVGDALAIYAATKVEWTKHRERHSCSRDFQLRNPGQAINSNIPSQRMEM